MPNFYDKKFSPLFADLSKAQIEELLRAVQATTSQYLENQTILHESDPISSIGWIESGEVQILNDDFFGNRNILAKLKSGDIFAETFVMIGMKSMPVSVISSVDSTITWIPYEQLVNPFCISPEVHSLVIRNLLRMMAKKNRYLNQKIQILTRRTLREKLLWYLASEAKLQGKECFEIPFNRQELADFISVDRSAMSRELSKLRKEGILNFHRKNFELLDNKSS